MGHSITLPSMTKFQKQRFKVLAMGERLQSEKLLGATALQSHNIKEDRIREMLAEGETTFWVAVIDFFGKTDGGDRNAEASTTQSKDQQDMELSRHGTVDGSTSLGLPPHGTVDGASSRGLPSPDTAGPTEQGEKVPDNCNGNIPMTSVAK